MRSGPCACEKDQCDKEQCGEEKKKDRCEQVDPRLSFSKERVSPSPPFFHRPYCSPSLSLCRAPRPSPRSSLRPRRAFSLPFARRALSSSRPGSTSAFLFASRADGRIPSKRNDDSEDSRDRS